MEFREITDYADIADMQALAQRSFSPESRWHIGDLAWERHASRARAADWRTATWSVDDECRAWGWVELPSELVLCVDPATPQLTADVLAWFDQVAVGDGRSCSVLESESHLVDALEAAGYRPDLDAPYFRHHSMDLASLAEPQLPKGFRLRHVQADEAEARAALHRASWSEFSSTLSTETYASVMSAWPYRPELDWIVEAPNGDWAASALIWLDEVNGCGLVEPVGCAPEYRRKGLAAAVDVAALQAVRQAGATTARVTPRGDDGYPIPAQLYRSIGFAPGPRTVSYLRTR